MCSFSFIQSKIVQVCILALLSLSSTLKPSAGHEKTSRLQHVDLLAPMLVSSKENTAVLLSVSKMAAKKSCSISMANTDCLSTCSSYVV